MKPRGFRAGLIAAAAVAALGASACSSVSHGQSTDGLERRTIDVDGESRSFLISIPEGEEPQEVIYAFHGWGLTAKGLSRDSDFHSADAIVVYPEGQGKAWAPAYYSQDPSGASDLAFMDALHAEVTALHAIDEAQVYAAGFSNGGGFARYLSCNRPEMIDGIATVGGAFFDTTVEDCEADSTPFLDIHGTADSTVAYEGRIHEEQGRKYTYLGVEEVMEDAARLNGCGTERTEVAENDIVTEVDYGNCDDAPVEHLRVAGMDHVWPRGEAVVGGIDATEEALEFLGI